MGIYVSRTLSYEGATFTLSELALTQEQQLMYNYSAEFWQYLFRVFFPVSASIRPLIPCAPFISSTPSHSSRPSIT
jgi:hypothetical protein